MTGESASAPAASAAFTAACFVMLRLLHLRCVVLRLPRLLFLVCLVQQREGD
jgi:hypothetical protein